VANTRPDVLISADDIEKRVDELAAQISADYADKGELVLIGVLKGAFIFLADLSRKLTIPRSVEFIAVSSYEHGSVYSGAVRLVMDVRESIEGRHVLIVEDIVDTGHTLKHVLKLLASRKPNRLEVCALLSKPSRREVEIRAKWIGFEIPDEFVVGYGIDYAQRNRNLPYIGAVEFGD
jgi:hypoxanthine phosphoribosyltransferase